MKKLFIAIGILFALNFGIKAQTEVRVVNVPLDPARKHVYDSLFHANDWRIEWDKKRREWYKSKNLEYPLAEGWMRQMLKVGDSMPDIELGTTLNNPTGKKRFSDFNGKIVILDFWNSSCRTCIGTFPKMKALQEKFGDKIQIILVNANETQEEIEKRMGKNINKIPDLLSIVNAKDLTPYFPTFSVPYHVWIDQKGSIRVIGSFRNTYDVKINDLLNHREIVNSPTEATRPAFNSEIPYYALVGQKIKPGAYNSFFTAYNIDYQPSGDGIARNKINTISNTIRNTFINCRVGELYTSAVWKILSKNYTDRIAFNPVVYEANDSLRYNVTMKAAPDTVRSKMNFCYEQVYPKSFSEEQGRQMMLQDLNVYFGKLYGTYGRIEKRSLPGFVVQKQSDQKYKKLLSNAKEYKETTYVKNGRTWARYQCISFEGLFSSSIKDWLYASNKVLVNESGIDMQSHIDIELPVDASLAEVKQALKPYGLEIKPKNIELEQLVISDTKPKKRF